MNGQHQSEIDQLVTIIQLFYAATTLPSQQSQLQLHLQNIQESQGAWEIIAPLLSHPDANVRFFGASTLQLKITRSWSTLPPTSHTPLKDTLLSFLALSASRAYAVDPSMLVKGEKIVMRKLASAVTSLSLRLEDWNDWLLEVILRVSGDGRSVRREAVLEVLSIAIEQVSRAELVGAKKIQYMTKLASSLPHLITTLVSSLSQTTSIDETNSALTCFTSFLAAGQLTHTELDPLYPLLLPHLHREQTVVNAASAIEELVERSSGMSGGRGVTRFMTRTRTEELILTWATIPAVRQVIENAIIEEDASTEALAIMKLLAILSEHFTSFLFLSVPTASTVPHLTLSSPAVLHLLHSLLLLTTFPGHTNEIYGINDLATGVWLSLQEECSDNGLVKGGGEGREGRRGKEEEWRVVEGVFEALAEGLRKRAEWPRMEVMAEWTKDVVDDFRNYRTGTLGEILILSYYILRDSMLSSLIALASQQVLDTSSPSYEPLEATLLSIHLIQPAVIHSPALTQLFTSSLLSSIPASPSTVQLRTTTLRLIGSYAEWFSTDQPEACLIAVGFIIKGLMEERGNPGLVGSAAKALRSLCDKARKSLIQHIASFVAVLGTLEGQIEDPEFARVLESVSSVVQALPEDQIIDPLLTLSSPILTKLVSTLSLPPSSPTLIVQQAREVVLQQLVYLLALSKGLSDPEGDLIDIDESIDSVEANGVRGVLADERVKAMRNALGNVVDGIAKVWGHDAEIIQALSEYIKLSTADATPTPLSLDHFSLLSLSSSSLLINLSPTWLNVSSHLIVRLARERADHEMDEEGLRRLAGCIEGSVGKGLASLSDLNAMNDNPDIVQAFVNFSNSIIRYYPRIFTFLPQHLDALISFAERGLGLQERFSLKSIIELLIAAIQQTRQSTPVASQFFRTILLPHLVPIITALILAVSGLVPRTQLTTLAELLHASLLRFPDEVKSILAHLLRVPSATPGSMSIEMQQHNQNEENWPTATATLVARKTFYQALMMARTGKQVRTAVGDFASVCRGLEGTSYGAMSLDMF